ncbi:MAG: hypothetical protein ACKPKO_29340, partial [Candidatus Fonsibacter sp.]
MSVFAAVTASSIKIPADNGMLSYVQHLRELLDSRVLTAIAWVDTRDMVADGATKGSVDRSQLHCCMNGESTLAHELKLWQAKGKMTSIDLAAASGTASSFLVQYSCNPQFSPAQAAQFGLSHFTVQSLEA